MNILYISVHSVLEDDEIRMFQRQGHHVFPLGVNFGFQAVEPFRDSISFNAHERAWLEDFRTMGCSFRYGAPYVQETHLTAEFVALFDLVVVMHELDLIERLWPSLSVRPVIWRTIGQNIDGYEPKAALLKARGMHIVRYSPAERLSPFYCGETALIRFGKNENDYGPWHGHSEHVLTFANLLVQRYPFESNIYFDITADLPAMLGGVGNEGLPGAIGLLTPEQQKTHYDACRGYLYCSGREVPYTLNFMEALMTGIPVVAFDYEAASPYYEVPSLLSGGAGLVASTVEEARAAITRLLQDREFATEVSRRGRQRAIELFGASNIARQWNDLFASIVARSQEAEQVRTG